MRLSSLRRLIGDRRKRDELPRLYGRRKGDQISEELHEAKRQLLDSQVRLSLLRAQARVLRRDADK